MNFIVYNSAGEIVVGQDGKAFANENGATITGLNIGETYRISPLNFDTTSGPEGTGIPHQVLFNNWADCSNPDSATQTRAIDITSASTISVSAYYRYHPLSIPDSTLPCYTDASGTTVPPLHV